MAKPLTPEQLKLADELKKERKVLRDKAEVKKRQMIRAFQQYSKLKSAHEHFVEAHAKIDRKLFLLTPGIRVLEMVKRKEKRRAKKKLDSGSSIADSIGDTEMRAKLEALIAKAKQQK